MKIEHDTTHPSKGGFAVGTMVSTQQMREPVLHVILSRGGINIDLPLEEAREVVGLLVEKINEIDSGTWLEKVRRDHPWFPTNIQGVAR